MYFNSNKPSWVRKSELSLAQGTKKTEGNKMKYKLKPLSKKTIKAIDKIISKEIKKALNK